MRPAPQVLDEVADALSRGSVVALPTDTVYGLVARAADTSGTRRLFQLKGRPAEVNLQVLVSDVAMARKLAARWPPQAERIARAFWPGGVTLVLLRAEGVDWYLGEDATSIGIRCPDHPVARELIARVGPLAATSANIHGRDTADSAEEIAKLFPVGPDGVEMIIDGGRSPGTASTVVDLSGGTPLCLRAGAVAFAEMEKVAGLR